LSLPRRVINVTNTPPCHSYSEVTFMATGSLALLAVLAGIAGFALYKHLKSQKKSTLIRPYDR
ncbi:hypothetical protein, partial [Klebsiella pneumoniae]